MIDLLFSDLGACFTPVAKNSSRRPLLSTGPRVDVSGTGNGSRNGNDQGTAPIPDRPVSQGTTANLRGTVATCMAK